MRKVLLLLCAIVVFLPACIPEPMMYVDNGTRYIDLSGTYLSSTFGSGNVSAYGGVIGRLAQFDNVTSITAATNTDAQVSAAVTASHTQNTDTILTTNGVTPLVDAGVLVNDLKTDRWVTASNFNTFLGVNVAGNDDLAVGGIDNTAVGYNAMYDITTGNNNVAVGSDALANVQDGYYNVAVGSDALQDITSGNFNVGIGQLAAGSITTGQFNVAVGVQSLLGNNGNYNVALGQWAGDNNTGSSNVFLGYSAGQNSGAVSNELYIANSDTATPLIKGKFPNDYVEINGDLYFNTAGSGLPYGCMHTDIQTDITCTLQSAWYQIPFDHMYVSNLVTLSDANDDMTIIKTGNYIIGLNLCRHTHFSNDYEWSILLNNGTVATHVIIHETTAGVGKSSSTAHTSIYTLTAGDTVEAWVRCTDAAGKVITLEHADLNITMIGR